MTEAAVASEPEEELVFRDARPEDRAEFLKLWAEMLEEIRMYGGEYEVNLGTMEDVRVLFDSYVVGSLFGCCVLYDPPGEGVQGAAFCGESGGYPSIRQTLFGKVGWGWGVYIRPEHRSKRVAFHLQLNTRRKLKALGFDTLMGEILLGNEAGLKSAQAVGWKPHSLVHVLRLEEWENG